MTINIASLFLTAGLSRRFEAPDSKLLQIYKGKAILTYGLEALSAAKHIKEIIAVTGYQHEKISKLIEAVPNVKIAYNENYENGMYSSLLCGFRNISDSANHILILPADMPKITAEIIDRLCENITESEPKPLAYVPVKSQTPSINGNPVILHKAILPMLMQYKQKSPAKGAIDFIMHLKESQPDLVRLIPSQDDALFYDIDSKKDFDS